MLNFDVSEALSLLAVAFVPALLGIILHEVAHGWMANRCGDPTARNLGRLTINPLPHIDPMGLLVFVLTSLSSPFVFGWAKPVPVDPRYFRQPLRDMMLTALAGPMTNFLLAMSFGVLLKLLLEFLPVPMWNGNSFVFFALKSCQAGVVINFGLAWLNLVPLPPLDGSKVLSYFLPAGIAWKYMNMARYGFVVLLVLLMTGLLGKVLGPLVIYSADALFSLLGLV